MIKPTECSIFHRAFTIGSCKALNASCKRWVNAVDKMTPGLIKLVNMLSLGGRNCDKEELQLHDDTSKIDIGDGLKVTHAAS